MAAAAVDGLNYSMRVRALFVCVCVFRPIISGASLPSLVYTWVCLWFGFWAHSKYIRTNLFTPEGTRGTVTFPPFFFAFNLRRVPLTRYFARRDQPFLSLVSILSSKDVFHTAEPLSLHRPRRSLQYKRRWRKNIGSIHASFPRRARD